MSCDCSPNPFHIIPYDNDDDTLIIDINYSQVQPDTEQLTSNMEEDSKDEIKYLGKLEYSIDYDFQKQQVKY